MVESFRMTIQMVNEELAKQTWARETWLSRVQKSVKVSLINYKDNNSSFSFYKRHLLIAPFTRPIKCKTLSQMTFGTLACGKQGEQEKEVEYNSVGQRKSILLSRLGENF